MTKAEHIEYAEGLLASAKDIAKKKPEDEHDRKANQVVVMDLLDFARTHAMIAGAM